MFGTDQIEALSAKAIELNTQPMCNVYVGAALRKPGTFPGARARHEDVLALTASYFDLDEPSAAAKAKDKYGRAKPTLVVVTGRDPHLRAQLWWRLIEPITDKAAGWAYSRARRKPWVVTQVLPIRRASCGLPGR